MGVQTHAHTAYIHACAHLHTSRQRNTSSNVIKSYLSLTVVTNKISTDKSKIDKVIACPWFVLLNQNQLQLMV